MSSSKLFVATAVRSGNAEAALNSPPFYRAPMAAKKAQH